MQAHLRVSSGKQQSHSSRSVLNVISLASMLWMKHSITASKQIYTLTQPAFQTASGL